jgi:tetratricopeptide (TPR) repeat protein
MSNIINTSEPAAKSRFYSREKIVIGGAIIVLAVIGVLVLLSGRNSTDNVSQEKGDKPADYNSLVVDINKENYQDALRQLDTLIEQAKNDKARAGIYVQKSALALNVEAYDDALRFAQKAEQLDPDPSVTAVVAKCAEAKGDKELAITYYRKAIAGLNPNTENGQGDIDIYSRAIKNLGGTP